MYIYIYILYVCMYIYRERETYVYREREVFDAPYKGMGGESGGVVGMLEVVEHIVIISFVSIIVIGILSDVMVWLIVLYYIVLEL